MNISQIFIGVIFAMLLYTQAIAVEQNGYSKVANDYEKGRPEYPQETIQILLSSLDLQPGDLVLDLAAGTGKLTRAIQGRGFKITAVEQVPEMCQVFSEQFPNILVLQGVAESLPLASNDMDAVIVATAFHWFKGDEALKEIARVLKKDGKLGLIWNIFDPEVSWVAQIRALLDTENKNQTHDTLEWQKVFKQTTLFTPLQHSTYRYSYPGTIDDVFARVFSAKVMGELPQEKQDEVIAQVRSILALHPDTKERQIFEIPYRVEIYWCQKKCTQTNLRLENFSKKGQHLKSFGKSYR